MTCCAVLCPGDPCRSGICIVMQCRVTNVMRKPTMKPLNSSSMCSHWWPQCSARCTSAASAPAYTCIRMTFARSETPKMLAADATTPTKQRAGQSEKTGCSPRVAINDPNVFMPQKPIMWDPTWLQPATCTGRSRMRLRGICTIATARTKLNSPETTLGMVTRNTTSATNSSACCQLSKRRTLQKMPPAPPKMSHVARLMFSFELFTKYSKALFTVTEPNSVKESDIATSSLACRCALAQSGPSVASS
mmetsp:Transcript_53784/g.172422  ORF Transcript_53784/g.172422 Transcript_53784/m.172422 type:complete len:248 (-) Transcript_53784:299-1042(-)